MAGTATRLDRATGGWLAQQGEEADATRSMALPAGSVVRSDRLLVQQYSELVHQHQWMKNLAAIGLITSYAS